MIIVPDAAIPGLQIANQAAAGLRGLGNQIYNQRLAKARTLFDMSTKIGSGEGQLQAYQGFGGLAGVGGGITDESGRQADNNYEAGAQTLSKMFQNDLSKARTPVEAATIADLYNQELAGLKARYNVQGGGGFDTRSFGRGGKGESARNKVFYVDKGTGRMVHTKATDSELRDSSKLAGLVAKRGISKGEFNESQAFLTEEEAKGFQKNRKQALLEVEDSVARAQKLIEKERDILPKFFTKAEFSTGEIQAINDSLNVTDDKGNVVPSAVEVYLDEKGKAKIRVRSDYSFIDYLPDSYSEFDSQKSLAAQRTEKFNNRKGKETMIAPNETRSRPKTQNIKSEARSIWSR